MATPTQPLTAKLGEVLLAKHPEGRKRMAKDSRRNRTRQTAQDKQPRRHMPLPAVFGAAQETPANVAEDTEDGRSTTLFHASKALPPESDGDDDMRETTVRPAPSLAEAPHAEETEDLAERIVKNNVFSIARDQTEPEESISPTRNDPQLAEALTLVKPPSVPAPASSRPPVASARESHRPALPQVPPPPPPVSVQPKASGRSTAPTIDAERFDGIITDGFTAERAAERTTQGTYQLSNEYLRVFLSLEPRLRSDAVHKGDTVRENLLKERRRMIACELIQRDAIGLNELTEADLHFFLEHAPFLHTQQDLQRRRAVDHYVPLIEEALQIRAETADALQRGVFFVPPAPAAGVPSTASTPAPHASEQERNTGWRFWPFRRKSSDASRPPQRPPRWSRGPLRPIAILLALFFALFFVAFVIYPAFPVIQQGFAEWMEQATTDDSDDMERDEAVMQALRLLSHTDACVIVPAEGVRTDSTDDAPFTCSVIHPLQVPGRPGSPPQAAILLCHCEQKP